MPRRPTRRMSKGAVCADSSLGMMEDVATLNIPTRINQISEKPTKEQIQWFWEQCGFKYLPKGSRDKFHRLDAIQYPDGIIHSVEPPIDLNNLFKYPVPKVYALLGDKETFKVLMGWIRDILLHGVDPALALFWAIYKALGAK